MLSVFKLAKYSKRYDLPSFRPFVVNFAVFPNISALTLDQEEVLYRLEFLPKHLTSTIFSKNRLPKKSRLYNLVESLDFGHAKGVSQKFSVFTFLILFGK